MKEKATAFAVGATGYPCIEILARGHTHWSMALLGGICVLALVWIARRYPGMNIAVPGGAGHGVHHSGGISRRAGGEPGAGLAGMGLQPGIRQCAGTDMPPVQLLLVSLCLPVFGLLRLAARWKAKGASEV